MVNKKLKVGISQCLLGDEVRYNGSHKWNRYCTEVLGEYFEYESVCPEMAVGMGVPREPVRLVDEAGAISVKGVVDFSADFTEPLTEFGQKMGERLNSLSGYIFMQKSPSCGVYRIKAYNDKGHLLHSDAIGVYAREFIKANPLMPVEEAGRLGDPVLRETFITSVYAYERWRSLLESGLTAKKLLDFYSGEKYLLMAHSPDLLSKMGNLLADLSGVVLQEKADEFIQLYMQAVRMPATRKQHTNVLMHIRGYWKKQQSTAEKEELSQVIERYRLGEIPLIAVLVLMHHFSKKYPDEYIDRQSYLNPYPENLGLRSAIEV